MIARLLAGPDDADVSVAPFNGSGGDNVQCAPGFGCRLLMGFPFPFGLRRRAPRTLPWRRCRLRAKHTG
jgi:hypothetical protein